MNVQEVRKIQEAQGKLLEQHRACGSLAQIKENCPCPGDCPLKGRCCACVAWHRDHGRKPLPYCLRDLEGVSWQPRPNLLDI